MKVFLGTLCSSVKQNKAQYVFEWEQGIAPQAMQGIGPHLAARGKSQGFSRVSLGTWVYSRVTAGMNRQNSCLFSDVRTPV